MRYDDWNRSGFKKELIGVRGHDVEPRSQSVFYSGPGREHGYNGPRNRERAERYAAREGTITIQKTARGNQLTSREGIIKRHARKMMGEYGAEKALDHEWIITSRNLAALAHGDVKAFVAGARKKDVFCKAELPQLLLNSRVQTINGIRRTELEKVAAKGNGLNRAYRMVALAHIRQEMQQALRTGDTALIRDALGQKRLYENQLRLDRGEQFDISIEAMKKREAELDRRTERLATMRQSAIRAEALQNFRGYVDHRFHNKSLSSEQARKMMRRAERTAQSPQRAYAMQKLIKLKIAREKAAQGEEPDIRAINNYLSAREQFQSDMRAVRQSNGQPFVASNPIDGQLNRRRHQHSAGRPKRHRNRSYVTSNRL